MRHDDYSCTTGYVANHDNSQLIPINSPPPSPDSLLDIYKKLVSCSLNVPYLSENNISLNLGQLDFLNAIFSLANNIGFNPLFLHRF